MENRQNQVRQSVGSGVSLVIVNYLLIFLLLISTIILGTSCSNQEAISLRYKMEKKFYNSERMRKILSINLKAATPIDFNRVIRSYEEVIKLALTFPEISSEEELSDIASSAQLRIAELYGRQNKYDLAKEALEEVLKRYPKSRTQNKDALLLLSQIYELKKEKEKAVETYHKLLDNYPAVMKNKFPDPNLLSVPHHLIQLFSPQEEKTRRESEFEYAQKYYENLIQTYPNTRVSLAATLSLARAFQMQNRWKESIEIMETAKDTSGQVPGPVILQIGDIYYDELKNEKNALLAFNRVINSSSDSSSKAAAQMKIGIIYFQKKDYPRAKEELAKGKKSYPYEFGTVATCQYLLAQTYEKTGEWNRALNEYNWLMVNYPITSEGLEAPLRIVTYYQSESGSKEKGSKTLASEYFEKGLKHYDKLLNKYKDKPFVSSIEIQKGRLFILRKEWDKAVLSFQKIAEKYPGTEVGLNSLLTLFKIYQMELKDQIKAKEVLTRIRSDYPRVIPDTLTLR